MAFLPPADVAGVLTLLNVISDPDKTRERLDQLNVASVQISQQMEELKETQNIIAKTRDDQAQLTLSLSEKEQALESFQEGLVKKEELLVSKDLSIQHILADIETQNKQLKDREGTLNSREQSLKAREDAVESHSKQVEEKEASLSEHKRSLEEKTKKLEDILNGI